MNFATWISISSFFILYNLFSLVDSSENPISSSSSSLSDDKESNSFMTLKETLKKALSTEKSYESSETTKLFNKWISKSKRNKKEKEIQSKNIMNKKTFFPLAKEETDPRKLY